MIACDVLPVAMFNCANNSFGSTGVEVGHEMDSSDSRDTCDSLIW